MDLQEAKRKYIEAWGSLGASWGITKAMGQIHALLLVSDKPLSTEDIMEELQISRGNANMNIRALIGWGIVEKKNLLGERKDYFMAEKDVLTLARQVSRERQKREIEPMIKVLDEIRAIQGDGPSYDEFVKVTTDIKQFSEKVNGVIDRFAQSDRNWFTRSIVKLLS